MPQLTEADVLQSIANELNTAIREPWQSVEMIVDYDPAGMMNFQNQYVTPSGETKHVRTPDEMLELIQDLAEAVQTATSPPFRRVRFTLAGDGTYQARYGYEEAGFPERSA